MKKKRLRLATTDRVSQKLALIVRTDISGAYLRESMEIRAQYTNWMEATR